MHFMRKNQRFNLFLPSLQEKHKYKIIRLTKEGMGIRSIARFLRISTTTLLKRIITISHYIQPPLINYNKEYEVDELKEHISEIKNK